MTYFVGAYATSPCSTGWDATLESEYYQQLKKSPLIKGLEHPFLGALHSEDDDWFLQNISNDWTFVFTCVPGIMAAIGDNPAFGIASDDEAGRQSALQFMAKARDAISKLNKHCGKPVVTAIEIQTAPNRSHTPSSVNALKASLTTMQSWDWEGTRIMIEHCDAYLQDNNDQTPQKGFLTLGEELEAIQSVNQTLNADMGVVINWGRSAIETRSTQGVLDHIEQAKKAGLLTGLMFSGVSDQDTEYGAWRDTHMPAAKAKNGTYGAAGSLMTETEIQRCLLAANAKDLPLVGIKLGVRPKNALLKDRLAYIDSALAILDSVC